jgi:hypothetical protein
LVAAAYDRIAMLDGHILTERLMADEARSPIALKQQTDDHAAVAQIRSKLSLVLLTICPIPREDPLAIH